jgi:hypothetical protein
MKRYAIFVKWPFVSGVTDMSESAGMALDFDGDCRNCLAVDCTIWEILAMAQQARLDAPGFCITGNDVMCHPGHFLWKRTQEREISLKCCARSAQTFPSSVPAT